MDERNGIYQIEKEVIKDLPKIDVGNMILFKSNESSVREPVFYIKETNNNIANIIRNAENLKCQLKDIVIRGGYCNPLIIIIRLNDEDRYIYGQWFNKYNNKDRELIKEIVFQDKLNFCIVNVDNRVYVRFKCRNIYKISIWEYFKISQDDNKWSQEIFESEVISINSRLHSKKELFLL